MQVNQDFADLFAALNAAEARYLLVGGSWSLSLEEGPDHVRSIRFPGRRTQ